jgi:hypothetical protein
MADSDSENEYPYSTSDSTSEQAFVMLRYEEENFEPLRPGDVILYNEPVSVACKDSIRVTAPL